MLMSLCAGVMVDKLGKTVSTFLFVAFCLIGSGVYALGAYMVNLSPGVRYGIMFGGRFIFGLGGGPITIVQNAYTATWFTGHELAMAFGCTLTISRVGSVVNYDLTPTIYKLFEPFSSKLALSYTLFLGSDLMLLSPFAAMALARIDNFAMKEKKGPYKQRRSTSGSVIAKK